MFERGTTFFKTITMVTEICCSCGVAFAMPSDLRDSFLNNPDKHFHCPNGHSQHFSESQAHRLQKQLQRERERWAYERQGLTQEKQDILTSLELANKARKNLDKKLKRVHNGVCPCCNRHFTNLQRHIETKHPELKKVSKNK